MNPFHDFKPEIKLFLIVAVVSAVLAVGGILLLKEVQPTSPTGGPAPVVQTAPPAPQPSSPQPRDQAELDFAGWQTYRSDEFGFEVEYPSNARIFESSEAWPFVSIEIDAGSIIVAPQQRYPRGYTNPEIHFQSEDVFFAGRMARKTSVLFEDEVASFFLHSFQRASDFSWGENAEILVNINHKDTRISNSQKLDALDQILSTFRFVE